MPLIKVGVPHWAWSELFALLPGEYSEVIVLPAVPCKELGVDFWIAPPYAAQAEPVAPWLRGIQVVHSTQAGVDWLRRFVPEGAVLCDAQGVHNIATAEWAVTAILASLKWLPFYGELQRRGEWARRTEANAHYNAIHGLKGEHFPPVLVEELHGQTVLIVGYGSIAQSIEERLAPFGVEMMRVARSARPGVEPVSKLRDLLPLADVVVLITPLTEQTRGLIGAEELALLKQGALLVNAARGPVVQTDALVAALRAGRIRAALDVTDPEPLPGGHPLWHAPNVLITPHLAGSSPNFMRRAFRFIATQVERFAKGEPLKNIVTGEY